MEVSNAVIMARRSIAGDTVPCTVVATVCDGVLACNQEFSAPETSTLNTNSRRTADERATIVPIPSVFKDAELWLGSEDVVLDVGRCA
jgi:hypothetical protein